MSSDNESVCLLSSTELKKKDRLPAFLNDILQMRGNQDVFVIFCEYFLSKVVGITAWKTECCTKTVSEMASVSDEAFTYLLLENYWDEWANKDPKAYREETAYNHETNTRGRRTPTKGKYTKDSVGSRRYGGWSEDGLHRFNELFDLVLEDRKEFARDRDEVYRQFCIGNDGSKKKRKRVLVNDRVVAVRHDDLNDLL